MPTTFTPDQFTTAVRAAASTNPTFVYPDGKKFSFDYLGKVSNETSPRTGTPINGASCAYFDPTSEENVPLCLFGAALHILGWTPADVSEGKIINTLLPLTEDWSSVRYASALAQEAQDEGWSWGIAVRVFDYALDHSKGSGLRGVVAALGLTEADKGVNGDGEGHTGDQV